MPSAQQDSEAFEALVAGFIRETREKMDAGIVEAFTQIFASGAPGGEIEVWSWIEFSDDHKAVSHTEIRPSTLDTDGITIIHHPYGQQPSA
jgi:hypothetical protein